MSNTTLLKMENITKLFPGVKALDNVNFQVEKGEIHALVGENGAGKSTLMNILSGVYSYGNYSGNIVWEDEICQFAGIKDSERKGIVIIHQELALIPYMSIAENMFLGNEQGSSYKIDWNKTYAQAEKYLKTVGLNESPQTLIKDISIGKQQLVEIAKALAKDVKMLILDEPTASLNEEDSQKLLDLMLDLKKQGMTSIIISHKLNEISYVADHITIIRDGSTIETLAKGVDDFSEPRIIKGMVGRELTDRFPKRTSNIGDPILEITDWSVYHPLYAERRVCKNVNLKLNRGEVVGISGLMGAGRTELAMSVFGKSYGTKISGQITINNKPVNLNTVREAIDHKIAYVSEDRKSTGLILSETIRENITLANLHEISQRSRIDKDKEIMVAEEYKEKLNVKSSSTEQLVSNLSGGNQQKVLLSKWMFTNPDILILDEPTRGIDVGAKYEIYNIINDLVAEGKSVIFISSDMPEILGMCDRVYVMNEGSMVAEFSKDEVSQEAIMSSILNANKGA